VDSPWPAWNVDSLRENRPARAFSFTCRAADTRDRPTRAPFRKEPRDDRQDRPPQRRRDRRDDARRPNSGHQGSRRRLPAPRGHYERIAVARTVEVPYPRAVTVYDHHGPPYAVEKCVRTVEVTGGAVCVHD
jgi:hypothetical protein